MKKRYLTSCVKELCFSDHKMAFVSGPRQCGKTTFARMLLEERKSGKYYNWDDITFRRIWAKAPKEAVVRKKGVPLIVFDEIHKASGWKRTLKGIYDTLEEPADILVTGSARLNVYKKGGDSLVGRYYHFRLHPFTLCEMNGIADISPQDFINNIKSRSMSIGKNEKLTFRPLFKFGGFPEPLFAENVRKANLWRNTRVERVIREDLRDLSRIPELSRIEMMTSLIPERIGSLFSLNSLREDLEVSYDTVKRWLNYLNELYYVFEVKPYSRSIARAIKRESKVYLWDYSEVEKESARFENLVACHLLKSCHYWTDSGYGTFNLHYIRNKQKQEIDFLITRDRKPWLPVEVKLNDSTPSSNWKKFLPLLKCDTALQILFQSGCWNTTKIANTDLIIASADDILHYFI